MKRVLAAAAMAVACSALSCEAGESLFSRVYTTETEPEGHIEIEQLVRSRSGRSMGTYSAFDYRTEFEVGVTDKNGQDVTDPAVAGPYLQKYYGMAITEPGWVGGWFWWYFAEDMVPDTKPMFSVLSAAMK